MQCQIWIKIISDVLGVLCCRLFILSNTAHLPQRWAILRSFRCLSSPLTSSLLSQNRRHISKWLLYTTLTSLLFGTRVNTWHCVFTFTLENSLLVLSNAPTKYRVVEPRGFIRPKCYMDMWVFIYVVDWMSSIIFWKYFKVAHFWLYLPPILITNLYFRFQYSQTSFADDVRGSRQWLSKDWDLSGARFGGKYNIFCIMRKAVKTNF